MQSVSSRIWTRVVVSISYNDNHYTTGTFYYIYSASKYPVCLVRYDREGFIVDHLKVVLRLYVVSEYQNSPSQLFENV